MPAPSQIQAGTAVVLVSDAALDLNGDPIVTLDVQIQALSGDKLGEYWDGAAWGVGSAWLDMTYQGNGISTYPWISAGTLSPGFYLVEIVHDPAVPNANVYQVQSFQVLPYSVDGADQVTFQVRDITPAGLGNTNFSVVQNGVTLATGVTGAGGDFGQLALPAGAYEIYLSRPQTSFTVPEDITVVAGGGNIFTFTGTVTGVITPPADPTLCRVYLDARGIDGSLLGDFEVIFSTRWSPVVVGNVGVLGSQVLAMTNVQGHLEVDLVRGAQLRVAFVGTNIVREITIPNLEVANLLDITEAVPDRFDIVPA